MQTEEYIDTKELARRIKMAPGTIRNMVWRGDLKLNVHYVKPTPRKVLFIWSAVEAWLYGTGKPASNVAPIKNGFQNSLINTRSV